MPTIIRPYRGTHRFPRLHGSGVHKLALGNYTQYNVGLIRTAYGVFLGIEGHSCYEFRGYVHWGYAVEKLGLVEADARNVADFLNDQLHENNGDPRQGRYEEGLCVES